MKNALLIAAATALVFTSTASAAPQLLKEEVDRLVARMLPACPDPTTVTTQNFPIELGEGLRATIVRIQSSNAWCTNQVLAVASNANTYFLGYPWVLDGYKGTPAEKIRQFAWARLQDTVEPTLGAIRKDGFYPVTLDQKTEYGLLRTTGLVDRSGTIFLPGELRPINAALASDRLDKLRPIAERSPWKGSREAKVTVYEFSDFQCPACKHTTGFGEKLVAEFGDRVRVVRLDLPLMNSHPWAFPAAVMGRAIWKQNPQAFWDYKDEIYDNQDTLNVFSLEDFARGFAKANGLDVGRFDADVASATLRNEILNSVGTAKNLQINGTPTFLVDGDVILPGNDAKNLIETVRTKVAK